MFYSLSDKTSLNQISWNLESARYRSRMVLSLWNLTGGLAALQPSLLTKFWAIRWSLQPFSRRQDLTRFYDEILSLSEQRHGMSQGCILAHVTSTVSWSARSVTHPLKSTQGKPPNLVKSQTHEIYPPSFPIVLKFDTPRTCLPMSELDHYIDTYIMAMRYYSEKWGVNLSVGGTWSWGKCDLVWPTHPG